MEIKVEKLVSTDWLEDNLGSKRLRVLDASWYLPSQNRNPIVEFSQKHISGAKYFDINKFSDQDHELPHMVPCREQFCFELSKLDVLDSHHVVFYDGLGIFSAARAWWLLKLFGFTSISVLDGGLPKWISENRPVTADLSVSHCSQITTKFDDQIVCDWKKVKFFMAKTPGQIIDARPASRFNGLESEPRPGLRSGHIPGSTNICYRDLLNDDQTLKSKELLLNIFTSKGVDLTKPIITSCGSGVTAAILFLALELVGATDLAIYDGSWAEWGQREDLEIETDL